jgi:PAS domain S-box-containing protein
MERKEHSLVSRYLVALLAPGLVAGVMLLTWPLFQGSPVALFLLAIIFCAWYGGFRPGLLSTVTSVLLADYFFLPTLFSLGLANRTDVLRLLIMTAVGLCCSALSGLARRATRRTESILSGVADVHLLLDRQWRYVYANDAAVRAIGRSREQILGRTLWESYPDIIGTDLDRQYRRAMNEGVPASFDFYYATTDTWWSNRFFPAPEGLAVFATDITERKRAEERLREYEKVVEGLDEMIVVVDQEYRYLLANRAFLNYRQLQREEVLGRSIPEFISQEIFDNLIKQRLDECFRGKVVKYELSYSYPKLGERDLLASYFPIEGRDGADRAVCILKDITEQRSAEELLRQSQRQLIEAQHIAHIGSWHWDLKTNDGSWSEELYRIFGLNPGEPPPSFETALDKFIHPDDLDLFQKAVEASRTTGEPCNVTYRIIRADGAERIIHSRGNVEMDDDGNPVRMFGTAQDITEGQRGEEALRDAEQKYRDIFENASEGIFQTTPEGQYISANPALARMHGFATPAEFINQRRDITREVYVDPARREEFKRLVETHGVVRGFEHQIYRKDGARIWISSNARAVRDAEGKTLYYEGTSEDITEQKVAEAKLRQSESQLAEAQRLTHLGSWTRDLATGEVVLSDELFRLFGVEPQRPGMTHQAFLELVHPEDRARAQTAVTEAIRTRQSRNFEYRVIRPDGAERILHERIMVTVDDQTGAARLFGTTQDITDRKGIEEALRKSEERYRELFENAKDALYVHDLSGRYTSFNRAAEQLSGFSKDEILGKHFSNFISPAHLKYTRENLCKKLDYEGETTYEVDLVTRDRKRVPIEISSRLIYENGLPVGVQGVARDITERRRAEEAYARYALIVESSDDAIIGKNLDGTILSWNPGAEKIYGYSAREVIGCHISILVPPDRKDEVPHILESIRKGKSINHHESVRRRKDGKLINVSLTISPIKDAQNKVVGASTIARDVTERKQAEQALQTFSRRLIEAQETERQHIARELHDEIGQVLTAVRINLLSLRGSAPSKSALPIEDGLAIVDEALDRVRELSLNLRPPVLDNLGLSSALRWYVDRYARRSGIVADLQTDLDGRRLRVDLETACFRITQEALTNIARHAQATHVLVRLECTNGNLDLKITDNGVGFDVGALIKDSRSALGLRGMEERAVAARGHLKIDSAPARGTEVRASFPLKDGA